MVILKNKRHPENRKNTEMMTYFAVFAHSYASKAIGNYRNKYNLHIEPTDVVGTKESADMSNVANLQVETNATDTKTAEFFLVFHLVIMYIITYVYPQIACWGDVLQLQPSCD